MHVTNVPITHSPTTHSPTTHSPYCGDLRTRPPSCSRAWTASTSASTTSPSPTRSSASCATRELRTQHVARRRGAARRVARRGGAARRGGRRVCVQCGSGPNRHAGRFSGLSRTDRTTAPCDAKVWSVRALRWACRFRVLQVLWRVGSVRTAPHLKPYFTLRPFTHKFDAQAVGTVHTYSVHI